jgi:hypothetical protein
MRKRESRIIGGLAAMTGFDPKEPLVKVRFGAGYLRRRCKATPLLRQLHFAQQRGESRITVQIAQRRVYPHQRHSRIAIVVGAI